ncbi:thiamine pyrophosphate-binding protein [Sinisalibacter aestuarii]|uniref:Acetolactate synthase n=1 Tax=Sinisalibacter aestuarii TaxID=2949426 RepID=A0ABQ5LYC2_9RHOB|nr:thiamine pyrophosphate-binding protein [Sinisalibacter aestuarii]GKY89960.1 acetolactate synthase [Sinisalibacter aestuarii]
MKVYEALAQALADNGATPLCGLVGDANAYLVNSFVSAHGGRYVATANENGAVLAAMGAAMLTGGVGFATVTHGPALTNCVTALAEAARSFTPLVLLCGDTAEADRENLQNIDQREVILSSGAGFEQMRSAGSALGDLARAVRRARSERRPIAFNMPANLLWDETDYRPVAWEVPGLPPGRIEGEALDNAVGMIAAARRPVVLAGRGAIDAEARAAILRFARRIEAPLATTIRAKNLFAGEDHALGVYGTVSTAQASEAILGADCLIAFGAGLNFHTTAQGSFIEGKRVIQVADRAQDLGRGAVADVAILGRSADVAETFLYWLDEAEIPGSGFTRTLPAQGLDQPQTPEARLVSDGTVDFLPTLARLNALLPQDRTLVTDAGRWMVRSYGTLTAPGPRDFITTASFGSIGLGMGAAIGAAAARPGRPTILFCGDGGFMLGNLTEFNTAVRERLDLIVVVFNDGSYGAEYIQLRDKQIAPDISLFNWPALAPLAIALGGDGTTIASDTDLDALPGRLAARDRSKPYLIDVKLDPEQVAMW